MARTRQMVAVMIVLVGSLAGIASAQDWVPSRYGADDRIGAANNLSSEGVLAAAQLIVTGKVYSLGVETAEDSHRLTDWVISGSAISITTV